LFDLIIDLFIEAFTDLLIELSFLLEYCLFNLLIDKSLEFSDAVLLLFGCKFSLFLYLFLRSILLNKEIIYFYLISYFDYEEILTII